MNESPLEPGWSTDPGWREAVRGASWFVVPFGMQLRMQRMQRKGADGLVVLRSVFLAFGAAIVLFAVVLTFLGPLSADSDSAVWAALGLAGYGAVVILVITPRVSRPLTCESDAALAGAFRTRFFVRIALSESIALFGFVATFLVGQVWVYYVAAAIALLGFARYAPSVQNVARDQDELSVQGCGRSLVAALRRPQPTPETG